jgi:hypothetical protein
MNIKEIALNEIHLHPHFIDEGISALLHTILYLRAPNSLKFQDHECMYLAPLSFAKCDAEDVDLTVRDAISNLLKLKSSIGPQISRGFITLTFFEYREQKSGFLIWQTKEKEKVCFERWHISVVVDETPLPQSNLINNNPQLGGDVNNVNTVYTRSSSGTTVTATNNESNVEMRLWSTLEAARDQVEERILFILEVCAAFCALLFPS